MTDSKPTADTSTNRSDAPIVLARVVEPDASLHGPFRNGRSACPSQTPTIRSRLWAILVILAIATVLIAVYGWNPAKEGDGLFPKCPTFVTTGLHCPGCGTLRAMHQLLHGHLLVAASYNLMMIVMLPMLAYGLLASSVSKITGRHLPCPTIGAKLAWTLLAVLILFTILRNVPYYPLTLLAPPTL